MRVTIHVNAPGFSPAVRTLLRRAVAGTLAAEGVEAGEVSLTLLGDGEIRSLNRDYLGHDRVTDVLSFALHAPDAPVLGDVYVGAEQARRQAVEARVSHREELVRLAVHGTLHVTGHDHPEGPDRFQSPMFLRQEELVRAVMEVEDPRPGSGAAPAPGSSGSGADGP